jgi:hypothetical protein
MPVTTSETIDQFVNRRAKEILESGGFCWDQFDAAEKIIAVLQAEKEYACQKQ